MFLYRSDFISPQTCWLGYIASIDLDHPTDNDTHNNSGATTVITSRFSMQIFISTNNKHSVNGSSQQWPIDNKGASLYESTPF